MSVDVRELQAFRDRLVNSDEERAIACEKAAKDAAKFLIDHCVMRTPVYAPVNINGKTYHASDGGGMRTGGALRKAWIDDNRSLVVYKFGNNYMITVKNNNYYASYVEKGHSQTVGKLFPVFVDGNLEYRKHKKGWIKGKYFLKISEEELRSALPGIVERRISAYLRRVIDG